MSSELLKFSHDESMVQVVYRETEGAEAKELHTFCGGFSLQALLSVLKSQLLRYAAMPVVF